MKPASVRKPRRFPMAVLTHQSFLLPFSVFYADTLCLPTTSYFLTYNQTASVEGI